MTEPIVFLDIDGVLNRRGIDWYAQTGLRRSGKYRPPIEPAGYLDPRLVARADRLLALAGAAAVVTSSWRATRSLAQIEAALRARGFRGQLAGATPVLSGRRRGAEILAWLAAHPVNRFVILDDTRLAEWGDLSRLQRRQVVTVHGRAGLTDRDVERALVLLAGGVEQQLAAQRGIGGKA